MSVTVRHTENGDLTLTFYDPMAQLSVSPVWTIISLDEKQWRDLVEAVEAEQAAASGDANTPWEDDPKTDERKVEAWLDS